LYHLHTPLPCHAMLHSTASQRATELRLLKESAPVPQRRKPGCLFLAGVPQVEGRVWTLMTPLTPRMAHRLPREETPKG